MQGQREIAENAPQKCINGDFSQVLARFTPHPQARLALRSLNRGGVPAPAQRLVQADDGTELGALYIDKT